MIAIGKYVLVRPDETKTESGLILIPEMAQKKEYTGTVVEVGTSVEALAAGDRVIFAGTGSEVEGGLLGFSEDDIMVKL